MCRYGQLIQQAIAASLRSSAALPVSLRAPLHARRYDDRGAEQLLPAGGHLGVRVAAVAGRRKVLARAGPHPRHGLPRHRLQSLVRLAGAGAACLPRMHRMAACAGLTCCTTAACELQCEGMHWASAAGLHLSPKALRAWCALWPQSRVLKGVGWRCAGVEDVQHAQAGLPALLLLAEQPRAVAPAGAGGGQADPAAVGREVRRLHRVLQHPPGLHEPVLLRRQGQGRVARPMHGSLALYGQLRQLSGV